jgi:hypothetical protein
MMNGLGSWSLDVECPNFLSRPKGSRVGVNNGVSSECMMSTEKESVWIYDGYRREKTG